MIVLPDTELLVLEALRSYLPGEGTYHVEVPNDWNQKLPYAVATKIPGGKSEDPRFIEHAFFSVHTVASTRKTSSNFARKIQGALFQAARDKFHTSEGVVSWMQVTKGPVPVRDGLVGKHPDAYMFDATYNMKFSVPT
jgi:hypothetical protein